MINLLFDITYGIRDFFGGFIGPNLLWFQLGSLILSGLFLWGIVYIIVKTSYFNVKIEDYIDRIGTGNLFRYRSTRRWKKIKKELASNDPEQWKLAILESDDLLNEILKDSGYIGIKLEDKLAEITSEQISNLEDIKGAHKTAILLKLDPNFSFTQEIVLETMAIYHKAFIELHLIDQ